MVMAPLPTRDSAVSPYFHGCLAFLRMHFPPQSPPSHPLDPIRLSTVNSSPSPGTAPQSLNSSTQPLPLPGDHVPEQCMYDCDYGKNCLILITFRLPQMSCFTLSLRCFFSDSDSCPDVGMEPLLQSPSPLRAGPVLLTLLFSPLVPSTY